MSFHDTNHQFCDTYIMDRPCSAKVEQSELTWFVAQRCGVTNSCASVNPESPVGREPESGKVGVLTAVDQQLSSIDASKARPDICIVEYRAVVRPVRRASGAARLTESCRAADCIS